VTTAQATIVDLLPEDDGDNVFLKGNQFFL